MMTTNGHYGNNMQLPSTSELQGRPKRAAVINRPPIRELEDSDVDEDDVGVSVHVKEDQSQLRHHQDNGLPTGYPLANDYHTMYSYNRPYLPTTNPPSTTIANYVPNAPEHHSVPQHPQTKSNATLAREYSGNTPVTPSPTTEDLSSQQAPQQSASSSASHSPRARNSNRGGPRARGSSSDGGPFFKPTRQFRVIETMERDEAFTIKMQSWIERGFFMGDEGDWTCYRRNYFQVSASFTGTTTTGRSLELPCLTYDQNNPDEIIRTITSFYVGIVARSAQNGREIELVQHTAKRDKGPQTIPQPQLSPPTKPGAPAHITCFERLQFKQATANNGRRKASQQYHVLVVQLHGRTADGMDCIIAESESANLVVRGRAPGHYQAQGSRESGENSRANTVSPHGEEEEEDKSGEMMDNSNSVSYQSTFSPHDSIHHDPAQIHHEAMSHPSSTTHSVVGSPATHHQQPQPPVTTYPATSYYNYPHNTYNDNHYDATGLDLQGTIHQRYADAAPVYDNSQYYGRDNVAHGPVPPSFQNANPRLDEAPHQQRQHSISLPPQCQSPPQMPQTSHRYDERPVKRVALDHEEQGTFYGEEQQPATPQAVDAGGVEENEAYEEDEESEEYQDDSDDEDFGRPKRKSSVGRKRKSRR